MPNWCSNALTITPADPDEATLDLAAFWAVARPTDTEIAEHGDTTWAHPVISFERFVPTPPALLEVSAPNVDIALQAEMIANYGSPDWFAWRTRHWGTKWSPCDGDVVHVDDRTCEVMFDSAWSPPLPWLETVAAALRQYRFQLLYWEQGNGMVGMTEACGDTVIHHRPEPGCEAAFLSVYGHGDAWYDDDMDDYDLDDDRSDGD